MAETPTEIRDRAVAVADYLLAVRARLDRPVRVLPGDAYFVKNPALSAAGEAGEGEEAAGSAAVNSGAVGSAATGSAATDSAAPTPAASGSTPAAPVVVGLGPTESDPSWLRVPNPELPDPPPVPPELRRHLNQSEAAAPAGALEERWREEVWRPWERRTREVQEVRDLHRRLFDLMHQSDLTATSTELVWGHGLLETTIAGERVRYPLIATPVLIGYEPDSALITVSPQGPSRLQTDALAGLDDRFLGPLLGLAGPAGILELDLWNAADRHEFYTRAVARLNHDKSDIEDVGSIFARPRQRHLTGFLENLRTRLIDGDLGSVGALAAIVAHEPSRLVMPGDDPERWRAVGERLLMPLPTNEAQESIARRLSQHRNVAVQGPPGTGKTHTIRNLICHLMANGKRVLVVAQKEDPLRVLRDGLPEEVRALCLAVLGRTSDQLVQLQLAARELSDRAATQDKAAGERRVRRLTERLEEAEDDLARATAGLRSIAESEAATYRIDGGAMTPAEVGAWLREHAATRSGIPDPVDEAPPLTADEFARLLALADRLTPADRAAALAELPDVALLPTEAQAKQARSDRSAAFERASRLSAAGLDTDAVRTAGRAGTEQVGAGLAQAGPWLTRRAGTWTDRLGRLLADPHWAGLWADHVAATEQLQKQLATHTRQLAGHRITVTPPLSSEPRKLQASLTELRHRFEAGRGVNRLLQAALFRVAEGVRVDGEPLRTAEDVELAAAWVRREQERRRLAEHWTEWTDRLGIPARDGDAESWTGAVLAEASQSLRWDADVWPELSARLAHLVPRTDLDLDAARLARTAELIAEAAVVFELDELDAADRAVADGLAPWPELAAAWRTLDGWEEARAETQRLLDLRASVREYLHLRDRLAEAAPLWAAQIDAGGVPAISGAACERAWQWRQAQTWFDRVAGSVDPAALARRTDRGRERIRRLTADLVVASAWLEVARALDDRRRAALADWTTALRKIGKGTGRNAAAWQAHAQRAMESAVEAVPVWVMSVDRAVEQFAGGARFDVVIVDEASQADLFALPVLSLADRAVVVGDDQQIGPQLGFAGSVTGLIRSHLRGVPSAEHFDPESSLYDHAVRRSPERILLTEHFRCVPPIIEFSSRHYYDGKIQPLRSDLSFSLSPVIAEYVGNGVRGPVAAHGDVNIDEAEALVSRVAAIVADPAYRGRTLGVISLLSTSGQASYLLERLRDTIGEDEIQARRLRVGDPYTFQGDERDVVLLSLVVADRDPRIAAFTKRDYHRRVNVAASRARDQLWIFHSVTASALHPDDARRALLTYATSLAAGTPTVSSPPETDFERAVHAALRDRGYDPITQFRIGAHTIDFVLPAPDGRRLAVECDGETYQGPDQWESDMRRQSVLERVGNCVFVRIRGSIHAREPEAALRPLWRRLDELGITPTGVTVTPDDQAGVRSVDSQ